MIFGTGCDIVEHQVAEKLNWGGDANSISKIFTNQEISLLQGDQQSIFYSGRFAVKESVLKCLGTGMTDGIALNDIEVLKSKEGSPILKLKGEVKKIAEKKGINNWHVSISHSTNYSIAFVIAEII